jgi:hypothetical protein
MGSTRSGCFNILEYLAAVSLHTRSFWSVQSIPYFSRISANSSVILRPKSSSRGSSLRHCVQLKKRCVGICRHLRVVDERNVALAQIRIIESGASCVVRLALKCELQSSAPSIRVVVT